MPVVFQTKIDKVLNYETPASQEDIIAVTRVTIEEHEAELTNIPKKLEDNGYRASIEISNSQPNGVVTLLMKTEWARNTAERTPKLKSPFPKLSKKFALCLARRKIHKKTCQQKPNWYGNYSKSR